MGSVTELIGASAGLLVEPSEHHQVRRVVARVDADRCIGCGLCYIVCRDGANQAMRFAGEARTASVDEERCVGCLLCRHVCPVWDCVGTGEVAGVIAAGMHGDALAFVAADREAHGPG